MTNVENKTRPEDQDQTIVSRSVNFTAHIELFDKGRMLLECRVTLDRLTWRATSEMYLVGRTGDPIIESKATTIRQNLPTVTRGRALIFTTLAAYYVAAIMR